MQDRRSPRSQLLIGKSPFILSALLFSISAFGASRLVTEIRDERQLLQLDVSVPADLPPEIAIWSVALGSFRGILVDLLWERHSSLREAGEHFEAVQLGRTITALQPKFPLVWKFIAWDMAYNISMASPSVRERWQWIQEGIRLLRDEGIRANPWSLQLHSELARFYWHRIAGLTDDTHGVYKREVAREWESFLGDPGFETRARLDHFRSIAEAPVDEAQLLLRWPLLQPTLQLLRDAGAALDGRLLLAKREPSADDPLSAWWTQRSASEARALEAFICAKILREVYRMDPQLMLDVMQRIGPVDWRQASSHALYWQVQGILRSQMHRKDVRLLEERTTDAGTRVHDLEDNILLYPTMTTILLDLWQHGRVESREGGNYSYHADLRFLTPYADSGIDGENLRERLENFVVVAHLGERDAEGEQVLEMLRDRFAGERYIDASTLTDICFSESISDAEKLVAELEFLVFDAYWELGSRGERALFDRILRHARQLHDEFGSRPEFSAVPPFAELLERGAVDFFERDATVVDVWRKSRAWKQMTAAEKQPVVEAPLLLDRLRGEGRRMQRDPGELFPQ